jgi:hypothetical protein
VETGVTTAGEGCGAGAPEHAASGNIPASSAAVAARNETVIRIGIAVFYHARLASAG